MKTHSNNCNLTFVATMRIAISTMLFFVALGLMQSCSTEDNPTTDPIGQDDDNGNDNNNNPDSTNDSDSSLAEDVVDKNLDLEGLYFFAGDGPDAIAKTDNPSIDRVINYNYVNEDLADQGFDITTKPMFAVAGQVTNEEKDVFDFPEQEGYAWGIYNIVSVENAPNLTPNARIEGIVDVTRQEVTGQALDFNDQGLRQLVTGKFKITALVLGVLGYTSDGTPVNSVTFEVDMSKFPRNADGVSVSNVDDDLLGTPNNPNPVVNIGQNINALFNSESVEVCLVKSVYSSSALSANINSINANNPQTHQVFNY